MCSKHLYPLAPFAEQLETRCIISVGGSWCADIPMKRDKKHYCHWQMRILWIGGGQTAKSMPPWRSSHLRPAVADCWLDCQHGGCAAFSSANVSASEGIWGGSEGPGWGCGRDFVMWGCQEIWKRDVGRPGWDYRGHKRIGVTGVARWRGTPDLDPMAALALLLPKQLAWNAGVQNEDWWTWGQRRGPICLHCPICRGPCFTAE